MAGTVVDAMPTIPASDATRPRRRACRPTTCCGTRSSPAAATRAPSLPRGARLRLTDLARGRLRGLLLHRRDAPAERLNVADTVKVQWQAYLGAGQLLLSDMGRVLATHRRGHLRRATTRSAARRPAPPTRRATATARRTVRSPNGRDHFAVALAKHGLGRRDIAPNINLFKGVRVEPTTARSLLDGDRAARARTSTLRLELPRAS